MRLILDTEFTDLNCPKLISLGLVSSDLNYSFYAELDDNYTLSDCSQFVINNVLPLLDAKQLLLPAEYKKFHAKIKIADCQKHLLAWFAQFPEKVEVWCDTPNLDWSLLRNLLELDWPANLEVECKQILFKSEIELLRFKNRKRQKYSLSGFREHHALDDAIVITTAMPR
jgi:hypothetical protein